MLSIAKQRSFIKRCGLFNTFLLITLTVASKKTKFTTVSCARRMCD